MNKTLKQILCILAILLVLILFPKVGDLLIDDESSENSTTNSEEIQIAQQERANQSEESNNLQQEITNTSETKQNSKQNSQQESNEAQLIAETVEQPESTEIYRERETTQSDKHEFDSGFRNDRLLNEHYDKHGKEMGFSSAKAYEDAAKQVVNNPDALHKTEKEDGDDVYYVEKSNEFVIVSTDGYIRTYFNPNGGIRYYNRQ